MPEETRRTTADQDDSQTRTKNFASIYFGGNSEPEDMTKVRQALDAAGYDVRSDMNNSDGKPKLHLDKEVE